jgi:hypothetical protein
MSALWNDLSVWFSASSWLAFLSTLILIIGVYLEDKEEPFPPPFSKKTAPLQPPHKTWGHRLVILGIAGELFFGILGFRIAKMLDGRQKLVIAKINERTERLKADNFEVERLLGDRRIVVDDAFKRLAKFRNVSLWLQTVPPKAPGNGDTFAAISAMQEARFFLSSFQTVQMLGWKLKYLDANPIDPYSSGVKIFSFRALPGQRWGMSLQSPYNSPYNAPLDTPEERAWCAAEALTTYLRTDLGLKTTMHLRMDDLQGRPAPPFDKLNPPRDVVIIQIGLNDREENLKMLPMEQPFEEYP